MTHDPHDDHETFIKTPKQLIIAVVLAFVVPIVIIVAVVNLVMGGKTTDNATSEQVAARIKPVAGFELVESKDVPAAPSVAPVAVAAVAIPGVAMPAAPVAGGKVDGETSYKAACMACHAAGIAGSPKFGDKAAWGPRIAKGSATLYEHALKGFNAMPPKGGSALSDAEVKAAVDYMVKAGK